MRRVALLGGCMLLATASALGAQVVQGRVFDADGGRPAAGALVTLVDSLAARLAPALVGEDGAYAIVAPRAGVYRVRVDLIGYETWLSAAQVVGASDTIALDVGLPLRRVALDAVVVTDASRCESRPQDAPRMLALWEEIRRALTISELSARRGLVPLDLEVVEQRRSRVVSRRLARATGSRPWATRSPKTLVEQGFVVPSGDGFDYIGPDAPILLSNEFVETHCFRTVRKRGLLGGGRVGLSFEPAPGREMPDVQGTIWLDERTSELRDVAFDFVNLTPAMQKAGRARGSLEFARQPAGTWYVRRWELAMDANSARGVATPVGGRRIERAPATLVGTVGDSTTGDPLVGATVHVPGIEVVRTDSLGRFAVTVADMTADALDFVVRIEHPRLASLGLSTSEQTVRLYAGRTVTLAAAVPSVRAMMAAICPSNLMLVGPLRAGLVIGRVGDGAPPDGARVVAAWPSEEALGEGVATRTEEHTVAIGSDGLFRACPVPLGRTIRLSVEVDGARGPAVEVTLPASALAQVDLAVKP